MKDTFSHSQVTIVLGDHRGETAHGGGYYSARDCSARMLHLFWLGALSSGAVANRSRALAGL